MGSVWGVVLGAVLLQLMQSVFLPQLSRWPHALGAAIGSDAAAAGRPGAMDPAALRHHPDPDDALPPRGADPGGPAHAGADLRRAARRGGARRLPEPATASPRWDEGSGARDPRRHGPVRRPGGAEQGRSDRAGRRRGRGDRAERLGQVHPVQRDHRPGAGHRVDPVPRPRAAGPQAAPGARARGRAHVPEHPAVPDAVRAGERADRPARAAAIGAGRLRAAHAAADGRGGGARASPCSTSSRCSATGWRRGSRRR